MKRQGRTATALRPRRGERLRRAASAGATAALCGLVSAGAVAQAPPPAPKPFADTAESQAADALFQQLLKDPKNVDLTFRYAQAAIKAGNIEGGISSLERLLLLDRNYPGIKLQLAELYAQIQSYDQAKVYLAQARNEPGVTPDSLARIDAVQKEVDRASAPTSLTANLLVGLRYQSNASAEPAGSDIIAGGVPQTLSTIFLNKSGWDAFAIGNAQYTIDFGPASLESNAIAYYSKAIGHNTLDLGALEVNSGPRFEIRGSDGTRYFSARPYIVANEVGLGEDQFLHGAGAGIALDRTIAQVLGTSLFYEYRHDWFTNVTLSPTATTQNSDVHSFGLGLSYEVIENGDLNFNASYALDDQVGTSSDRDLVLRGSYSQLLKLPGEWGVGPLNLSPFVYRIYNGYHEGTPANPTGLNNVNEWRFGVTAKLGITDNLAANFHVVRSIDTSNVAADRSSNTQVIMGLLISY